MISTLLISFRQLAQQQHGAEASRKAGRWLWIRLAIAGVFLALAIVLMTQDGFQTTAPWAQNSQQVDEDK
jgi:succinate-acetate transporter protein